MIATAHTLAGMVLVGGFSMIAAGFSGFDSGVVRIVLLRRLPEQFRVWECASRVVALGPIDHTGASRSGVRVRTHERPADPDRLSTVRKVETNPIGRYSLRLIRSIVTIYRYAPTLGTALSEKYHYDL